MNNYSTAKDAERFVFYRIPKALITAKEYRYISTDAIRFFLPKLNYTVAWMHPAVIDKKRELFPGCIETIRERRKCIF